MWFWDGHNPVQVDTEISFRTDDGRLFVEPVIWGMIREDFCIRYDKVSIKFLEHIDALECTTKFDCDKLYMGGEYAKNGVVRTTGGYHTTLFDALWHRINPSDEIYIPTWRRERNEYVRMTFKNSMEMFITKAKVMRG